MRFFLRWIIIGLPLLWPAIANAQLMDKGSERPKPKRAAIRCGAWMADSTAYARMGG